MTRTITLAKGGQRYVFRCSGDSQAPLVEKLIRLARSRPDVARNVHLRHRVVGRVCNLVP
jgi:hypothetical protein